MPTRPRLLRRLPRPTRSSPARMPAPRRRNPLRPGRRQRPSPHPPRMALRHRSRCRFHQCRRSRQRRHPRFRSVSDSPQPVAPVRPADFPVRQAADSGPFDLKPPTAPLHRRLNCPSARPHRPMGRRRRIRVMTTISRNCSSCSSRLERCSPTRAAAQNELLKVNNEIQQAQAAVNTAAVQIPQLTMQLANIQAQLSGPPMPLNTREQLKANGNVLATQLNDDRPGQAEQREATRVDAATQVEGGRKQSGRGRKKVRRLAA